MIKHFGVFPQGFDKNNLFDEQKIFLIYLMGVIPSFEDWQVQVDYKMKKEEIINLKSVEIDKTEIDLAKMKNEDIAELKKKRLRQEKEKLIDELNEKFNIEKTVEEIEIEGLSDKYEISEKLDQRKELIDILQGRGLVKKAK